MLTEKQEMHEVILSDDNETTTTKVYGYFISSNKLLVIIIVTVLLFILVGVLAAYLGPGRKKGGTKVHIGTVATTKLPTTTKRSSPTHDVTAPYNNVRLSNHVKPVHYDVFLDVDMLKKVVNGTATIKVEVTKPTKYIIIHAHDFQQIDGKVIDNQNNIFKPLREFSFIKNQFHVIEFESELNIGTYSLKFYYFYKLQTRLKGFYYSTYKTNSGAQKSVAATQFQPVDARTAFPCFDEPAMRATFNITLGHEKGYIAISNMPIAKTWCKNSGERCYDQFERTPKMPTYLLAFVICDFAHKTVIAKGINPVKMTYYAPEEKISRIDYAMHVGSKILPFYEKYYNISYPLPKLDMIALPNFAAGGMENWGLIAYRMKGLLYDNTSVSGKMYIASIISHELAHQWFGNIVTMDWWSDLWLNEGFATYVSALGIDYVHPDWNILDFQVIDEVADGMELDSLLTSHPIYIEVLHPFQIGEIFDAISYKKGGSVLRMLDNFLGNENFIKGLNKYLKAHSYGSAKTKDLWDTLSEASTISGDNYNVSEIMNTWVLQMGFPVVTISKQPDGTYHLKQSQYLKNPKGDLTKPPSKYGYKWVIPFDYMTLDSANTSDIKIVSSGKKVWMNMSDAVINDVQNDHVIKGNAGQYGFFRVNYDADGWKRLIYILKNNHKIFNWKDRAGLLLDAFALANSGYLNYSTTLDLLDYIDKDSDYLPWRAARSSINYINSVLGKTRPAKKLLKKYVLGKVSGLYEKIKFRPANYFLARKMQVTVLNLACYSGHKDCLGEASKMFHDWMVNGKPVPSDFRSLVYYYGIYNGGAENWDSVFKKYLTNKIASEKLNLMYALAATQEPFIIDRYLSYALNESIVKSQDAIYVFQYVARYNPSGRYHAWKFLTDNWETLEERFGSIIFALKKIISSVTSGFSEQYELDQMNEFVKTKLAKDRAYIPRVIKQSMEKIKANIEWLKTNEKNVEGWLKQKTKA